MRRASWLIWWASVMPSAAARARASSILGSTSPNGGVVDAGAAGVDLRAGHHLARAGVDHDHHRDEAFLAEDAPVLQLRLGDLADGEAVDVDVAARHRAGDVGLAVDQVDDHAVLGDHDVAFGHAGQRGQPRRAPAGAATRRAPA